MSREIDMNDWEGRCAQAWAEIDDYEARGDARGRLPAADRRAGR